MRIICAPDGFKDSMSAATAARQMALGLRDADPSIDVDVCPVSDGGEGFREAVTESLGGVTKFVDVAGPAGGAVRARVGFIPPCDGAPITAVIEMAAASGLEITPPGQRDPTRTTTLGTGQMISFALERGARRILMGIGGSATNDGGCGMAQALGVRFLGAEGRLIREPITGGMLTRIASLDTAGVDPRLAGCEIRVACDVDNPLTGPDGAAQVYAPQKGATPEQVRRLDAGLAHLAAVLRDRSGIDVTDVPGAGAAGGLGAGAVSFLGASLTPGVRVVLDAVGFDERVSRCDLCLTGEGRIDGQTLSGKTVMGVVRAAAAHGIETIALVGSIDAQADPVLDAGLRSCHVIGAGLPFADSIARGPDLIRIAAAKVGRTIYPHYS
jgi:glycerate 2-kinase